MAQNMPPNVPLWHYSELKTLEKQQVQGKLSALPFAPQSRAYISRAQGARPAPGREHCYHQSLGADIEMEPCKQTY